VSKWSIVCGYDFRTPLGPNKRDLQGLGPSPVRPGPITLVEIGGLRIESHLDDIERRAFTVGPFGPRDFPRTRNNQATSYGAWIEQEGKRYPLTSFWFNYNQGSLRHLFSGSMGQGPVIGQAMSSPKTETAIETLAPNRLPISNVSFGQLVDPDGDPYKFWLHFIVIGTADVGGRTPLGEGVQVVRYLAKAYGPISTNLPIPPHAPPAVEGTPADPPIPVAVPAEPQVPPPVYGESNVIDPDAGRLQSQERVWSNSTWGGPKWRFSYAKWRRKHADYDGFVQLGCSRLYVAPKQIQVSTNPDATTQGALREPSSLPGATWRAARQVVLSFEIPGRIDRSHPLWAKLPKRVVDGQESVLFSPLEELRKLLVQARVAPFLPVRWGNHEFDNPHLPDIDALAVHQLMINTVPQVPDLYQVTLVGVEFNWRYYLKDPDKLRFEEYFVWPIYEKWIAHILDEQMPPIGGIEPGEIRISLPNEQVLANAKAAWESRQKLGTLRSTEQMAGSLTTAKTNVGTTSEAVAPVYRRRQGAAFKEAGAAWRARDEAWGEVDAGNQLFTGEIRCRLFTLADCDWMLEDSTFRKALLSNVHFVIGAGDVEDRGDRLWVLDRWRASPIPTAPIMSGPTLPNLSTDFLRTAFFGFYERDSRRPAGSPLAHQGRAGIRQALESLERRHQLRTDRAEQPKINAQNILGDESLREDILLPGVRVESLQLTLTNILAQQEVENETTPVHQFWGSPEFEVNLTLQSNTGLEALQLAYDRSRQYQIEYGPVMADRTGLEPGFWLVREWLINQLGLRWGLAVGVDRQTTPQISRGEEGQVQIRLFLPNPLSPLSAGNAKGDVLKYYQLPNWQELFQFKGDVQRSQADFRKLILRQLEIETRLRVIPLYPDLYLPTWETLKKWVQGLGGTVGENPARLPSDDNSLQYSETPSLTLPRSRSLFVDPDFYLCGYDPYEDRRLLGMRSILEGVEGTLGQMTFTSRLGESGRIQIADQQDSPPPVSGMDDEAAAEASLDAEQALAEAGGDVSGLPVQNFMEGETIVEENPWSDPGTLPLGAAVKGMFHDFVYQTPYSRLLGAFPTMLVMFYRDGKWLGFKRLWDQFHGRLPIRYVRIHKSMDRPDDVATIGIGVHAMGMAGRDLTANAELGAVVGEVAGPPAWDGGLRGVLPALWEVAAQTFGVWEAQVNEARGTDPYRDRVFEAARQRWEDLSNALVLAPGTRVHIRLGYGSTLDRLPTVFNGSLTEVEAGEEGLDLICGGDGLELTGDLFLKRVSGKEEGEAFDEAKSEWRDLYPRKWLLDILGSYNSTYWQKVLNFANANAVEGAGRTSNIPANPAGGKRGNAQTAPIYFMDQTYGIEHFGSPIPVFGGRANSTTTRSFLQLGAFNYVNATELGQNIYSSHRSGVEADLSITESLVGDDPAATAQLGDVARDLVTHNLLSQEFNPIVDRALRETIEAQPIDVVAQPRGQQAPLDALLADPERSSQLTERVLRDLAEVANRKEPQDTVYPGVTAAQLAAQQKLMKPTAEAQRAERQIQAILRRSVDRAPDKPTAKVRSAEVFNALGVSTKPAPTSVLPRNPFGEHGLRLDVKGKSFFDVARELARLHAGFITAVCPFGYNRSTIFWGKPHYPLAFTYGGTKAESTSGWQRWVRNNDQRTLKSQAFPGTAGATELIKTFSQVHFAHARFGLIRNAIRLDGEQLYNKGIVYWKTDTGQLQQAGRNAFLPGEQVLKVQVDDDILPEEQRQTKIVVPFSYSFWAKTPLGVAQDIAQRFAKSYAFSSLADSVRTMYNGHLLLFGNANVKPWDYIYLQDDLRFIQGLCQVREVTHHAELGLGFVTDVKPGAIAWNARSDVMLGSVGASIVAGRVAASIALADVVQRSAADQRRLVMGLLQQAIATADHLLLDRNVAAGVRDRMAAATGELRSALQTIKNGTFAVISARMRSCIGNENEAGLVGRFLTEALAPAVGENDHRYRSLQLTLSKVRANRAALERSGAAQLFTVGPETATQTTEANRLRALEAAGAILSREQYRVLANLKSDDQPGGWGVAKRLGAGALGGIGVAGLSIAGGGAGLVAGLLGSASAMFAGAKLASITDASEDGVVVMLLTRAGREFQTGLSGHRGCVVGESAGALNHFFESAQQNPVLKYLFNIR
jgi:uncharacterized membrane protein